MAPSPDTFQTLLDETGLRYKQNRKSFVLTCPRCRKQGKLYLRKSDGRFTCWVCRETHGFGGAPEWFFAEVLGGSIDEIRRRIYGEVYRETPIFLDIQLRDWFDEEEEVPVWVPPDLPEVLPDPGFRTLDSEAGIVGRKYLESRGVSLELAQEYSLQHWPAENRVVFPLVYRGKLLGWQSRWAGSAKYYDATEDAVINIPKALTTTSVRKDQILMFADRLQGSEHAVLCEGPLDAIKAHLCGGNVASLGKSVSPNQLALLKNSGIKKLYIALDPDAFMEAKHVLKAVSAELEVYDMRPQSGDIGDMSCESVLELFRNAPRVTPANIFIWIDKELYG
jgi:hypothetical protein